MSRSANHDGRVFTVDSDLLRRYDRPGPRYTSYPTAKEFHEGVGAETYASHLERAGKTDAPLAFYIHLPFCDERCLFCGCNVVVTRRHELLGRYLDAVHREIRMLARHLGDRRGIAQYHWGGGTPTYLTPDEMVALQEVVDSEFRVLPDAEVAIEVDPRVTTAEHLAALREMGFSRLSMGVQDFTPEVQQAVNRIQPFEMTRDLVDKARELGFVSLNLDLIYGLPLQGVETFAETLEQVKEIRPERIALYSFAHVPWLKGHQRKIPPESLPEPQTKLEIFASAVNAFTQAGYLAIGMDHFALPEDEMGQAVSNGTLWRNFMGYTVRHAPDMVAVGMSGIGNVAAGFFQNHAKLIDYERAIESDRFAVERGYVLRGQDELRAHVITALMCTFSVNVPDVERRFGIRFWETFDGAREQLAPMIQDGFVRVGPERVEVVGNGRFFVRNACMAFDEKLKPDERGYSRTV